LAVGGHVSLIGASLSSSGTGLDPLLLTGRGITLLARHCVLNGPKRVSLSPLSVSAP
jgi:hypothetical protein